jgi:hypothetical protein
VLANHQYLARTLACKLCPSRKQAVGQYCKSSMRTLAGGYTAWHPMDFPRVETDCPTARAIIIDYLSWSIAAVIEPSALETCLSSLSIFSFSCPSLCFVDACGATVHAGPEAQRFPSDAGAPTVGERRTSNVLRKSVSWNSDSLI